MKLPFQKAPDSITIPLPCRYLLSFKTKTRHTAPVSLFHFQGTMSCSFRAGHLVMSGIRRKSVFSACNGWLGGNLTWKVEIKTLAH